MVTIGRLDTMSAKDKEDMVAYIASINIQKEAPTLTIPTYIGNAKKGKKLYKGDCKTCHGKKAEGKEKKKAPPTSWQYSEYLLRQIDFFKNKDRIHDNDPEDETFDDYSKEEINDILTFISTLDD
jgi:cytochrome c553